MPSADWWKSVPVRPSPRAVESATEHLTRNDAERSVSPGVHRLGIPTANQTATTAVIGSQYDFAPTGNGVALDSIVLAGGFPFTITVAIRRQGRKPERTHERPIVAAARIAARLRTRPMVRRRDTEHRLATCLPFGSGF